MYNGYTETQAQQNARAARIAAEVKQREIRDAMIAEVAPMFDTLRAAVAGTYTVDDADGVDMIDVWNWQIKDLEQATNSFMTESQAWKDEAEALAADARDYAMQTEELRGGG